MTPRRRAEATKTRRQRPQRGVRRKKRGKKVRLPASLKQVNLNAAGIDIGAGTHYVAVPEDRDAQAVRSFGAFTGDLAAIADWLESCEIETVAMESTGVYWIPLMEVLEEREFEVLLVDPHKLKNVSGRKTDVLDCQWIQQLHTYGLLSGAFRPEAEIVALRAYLRQRDMLIHRRGEHTQHMQKAMAQMNVKLSQVVSDITGVTGMRILQAIVAGERDPETLARLRDGRCRKDEATIAEALRGHWREEHLFALRQALELYEVYQEKIAACDDQIQAQLESFDDRVEDPSALEKKPRASRRAGSNPFHFDAGTELHRVTGVDLTLVPGIEAPSALKIVSEIGLDMTRWRNDKAFGSWLGVCPGSKVTGGKRLSGRTKPCANRAAVAFRMAAYGLQNSKSYLGAWYRRMKARLGAPKAITATAYKLARIVYAMLRYGTEYVEKGMDFYEKEYRRRAMNNLKRNARNLGYKLVPLEDEAALAVA